MKPDISIQKYMNILRRKLRIPSKIKKRVLSDFSTGIYARMENGEPWEMIYTSLGTPADVAAEINSQMQQYTYRKSPWRFVCLIIGILGCLYFLSGEIFSTLLLPSSSVSYDIGIIGGADGPTEVFISASPSILPWLLGALFLVAGIILYLVLGHLHNRKR